MGETKRMTAEQVVSYLLEEEGLDFLRESLSWVVQQLMEATPTPASPPPGRHGNSRLAAASMTRSVVVSCGLLVCRRSTDS
jgi:hypothetical protein